ncbi:hypothetical protein AAY473_014118 [Plecturocebus cupreus]
MPGLKWGCEQHVLMAIAVLWGKASSLVNIHGKPAMIFLLFSHYLSSVQRNFCLPGALGGQPIPTPDGHCTEATRWPFHLGVGTLGIKTGSKQGMGWKHRDAPEAPALNKTLLFLGKDTHLLMVRAFCQDRPGLHSHSVD